MFHNIFEKFKNKFRKPKREKIKPKIIIDIHEKNSLVISELKANKEIETEIRSLKIADYLIGETAIERKTFSDFVSSMLSKRIVEQLKNLQKYKNNLLIIEGYEEETKINPNAIRGFILSIILNYKIPVIFTKDYEDTAAYLITLAKQQAKPRTEISLHSRIPKTEKEQKQYILEAFPNIGPKTAKKLIEKFSSLKKIFNADEQEIEEILRGRTGNFKQLLD